MGDRILLVEDEVLIAMGIESIVLELGYSLAGTARDSGKALELGSGATLALVDLNLTDGATGAEVGRRLAGRGVTVTFMSANPAQLGRGVPGTLGVIAKPLDDRDVREVIAFAAAMHGDRRDVPPPRRLRLFEDALPRQLS